MKRRGVTLIELLITLSILGILAGVTVLAVRRIDAPRADDPQKILADSARVAMETGRTISIHLVLGGISAAASVRPDGSIIADSAFAIERFTGAPVDAR